MISLAPSEKNMTDTIFLTTEQAAHRIGLAVSTLKNMRVSGRGPRFIRGGRKRIFYEAATLDAWMRGNEFGSTSEYKAAA